MKYTSGFWGKEESFFDNCGQCTKFLHSALELPLPSPSFKQNKQFRLPRVCIWETISCVNLKQKLIGFFFLEQFSVHRKEQLVQNPQTPLCAYAPSPLLLAPGVSMLWLLQLIWQHWYDRVNRSPQFTLGFPKCAVLWVWTNTSGCMSPVWVSHMQMCVYPLHSRPGLLGPSDSSSSSSSIRAWQLWAELQEACRFRPWVRFASPPFPFPRFCGGHT